jgi:hypothetical protein
MESDTFPKKRGRKPKNYLDSECQDPVIEKKKRGRKKKYEIENFEKILNRDDQNNFDHSIAYSDDEEPVVPVDVNVKKISFGSLDITVSKKIAPNVEVYRNQIKSQLLNESEYSSDEEKEVNVDNIILQENFEKYYKGNKKYIPGVEAPEKSNSDCVKQLRVVTTLQDTVTDEHWPEKTNVHCWWCCHPFECSPCTLPTKYDPHRKRFTFTGIFCSWNCTKAYNFNLIDCKKYERSGFITLLIQQLYGLPYAINIKAAPPKQCLKMFGGYMDIEQFRNGNSHVSGYHLNLIHYIFIRPEVTEISSIKLKTEKTNLKLFRPVPR